MSETSWRREVKFGWIAWYSDISEHTAHMKIRLTPSFQLDRMPLSGIKLNRYKCGFQRNVNSRKNRQIS